MPEPHADTSTAVASTYEGTVRLGIGAPSVLAPRGVVNPGFSWRKAESARADPGCGAPPHIEPSGALPTRPARRASSSSTAAGSSPRAASRT